MALVVKSKFAPGGDQEKAIRLLSEGYYKHRLQTLLGITGSGKTFVAAKIIEKLNLPTLIITHNKTLAAQLYAEFKEFFPDAAVEYFVSFYDYYQPESYLPTRDLYIDKDFSINEEIEKLRNSTTKSLMERKDVIVVASVSAIYNVGIPETYRKMSYHIEVGLQVSRDIFLKKLVDLLYRRNEYELAPRNFRAKGDVVEVFPIYQEQTIQVEFFGEEVDKITLRDPITGKKLRAVEALTLFPATQYLTDEQMREKGIETIRDELTNRNLELMQMDKNLEANRLTQRTNYDIEQLQEFGHCKGIENYSRHFDGKQAGEPPYTLIDYFPKDFLLVLDESHVTIPQITGMYGGDFSRKKNLINYGFRLPSAYDNRPLKWDEFLKRMPKSLCMSATPGNYELECSEQIVEQIIRPTGLLDPKVDIRKTENQIDDVILEIEKRVKLSQKTLVTTLTKRMAEDLAEYLLEAGIKATYMHSDIDTLERIVILQKLRKGEVDVVVGINLLREGLDLPEVSLVAIFDADKEGFLRSHRSLIQTMGRASRNVDGRVILYADRITKSIHSAVNEVTRRRKLQKAYNKKHNIQPKTVLKGMGTVLDVLKAQKYSNLGIEANVEGEEIKREDLNLLIDELVVAMGKAANELEFEIAAELRDKIKELKDKINQ